MNVNKVIYWVATTLLCLLFLYSAQMYFFNYEGVTKYFENIGFPAWLVYPLAIAKVLGVVAILSRKSILLKEWAYAGFFFDAVMAAAAHYMVADGGGTFAFAGILFVVVSRFFEDRTFPYDNGLS